MHFYNESPSGVPPAIPRDWDAFKFSQSVHMTRHLTRNFLAASIVLLPVLAFGNEYDRGTEALQNMNYDQAIAHFDTCIRENASDANALYCRGIAYGQKKDYDKAIADFSEIIRLNPEFTRAYSGRAAAYSCEGKYDSAIRDDSETIRLDPSNAQSFRFRGDAYHSNKEYLKAATDYSEAIRLDPELVQALSNFAWLLATCPDQGLRNGRKALKLATRASDLSQWKNHRHLTALAAAYAEVGDFKEATRWMKKAIELGKGDDEGRAMLKAYENGSTLSADGGSP